jgi:hypothetical protein
MGEQCDICDFSKAKAQLDVELAPDSREFYPITHNGKPSGRLLKTICSYCLGRANEMRKLKKAQQSNATISRHALERFLERQKGERMSEETASIAILRIFNHAKRIVLRNRFMAERLRNNDGRPAHYLFHAGYIFVTTTTEPATILTIERQWHRKIGRDFWYADEQLANCASNN